MVVGAGRGPLVVAVGGLERVNGRNLKQHQHRSNKHVFVHGPMVYVLSQKQSST